MPSFEEVQRKIQRNYPKDTRSRRDMPLTWDRETAHTITSTCGIYRIVRMEDPQNEGLFGYALTLAATPTSAPKHLAGPYLSPKDARDAAERHRKGEPLQADLA